MQLREPRGASATFSTKGEKPALVMSHAFQPVVDLRSGCAVGFEALARFGDRQTPQSVLRGLKNVNDLRRFDAESAALAAASSRFWLPVGTPLFINLTWATLAAALAGAPPPDVGDVIWEVPERHASAAARSAPDAWRELTLQYTWALDDAPARITAPLGARWIKMTRNVVRKAARNPRGREALRTFSAPGMSLVTKGVETPEDIEMAFTAGIHFVQGFVAGRPETRPAIQQPSGNPAPSFNDELYLWSRDEAASGALLIAEHARRHELNLNVRGLIQGWGAVLRPPQIERPAFWAWEILNDSGRTLLSGAGLRTQAEARASALAAARKLRPES